MGRFRSTARRSCGGIREARPNDGFWIEAQRIVNEMAEDSRRDKMDSPPVGPVHVIKLTVKPVAVALYFITFRAIGENGLSTDYTTEVWRKPASEGIKILSFAKVKGSEKEVKGFETGSSDIFEEKNSSKGKESLDVFKGLSAPVQTELEICHGEEVCINHMDKTFRKLKPLVVLIRIILKEVGDKRLCVMTVKLMFIKKVDEFCEMVSGEDGIHG